MAKFAREEKPFDPISNKVLSALASSPQPANPAGSPADDPPALLQEPEAPSPPAAEAEVEHAIASPAPNRPAGTPARRTVPRRSSSRPGRPERLTRAVKCLLTPTEERELRALVSRLASEAGTSLTLSHLLRPYLDLLRHCEEQLAHEFRRTELIRPLNDKTHLALFERELASLIHMAMRKTPSLRIERPDAQG